MRGEFRQEIPKREEDLPEESIITEGFGGCCFFWMEFLKTEERKADKCSIYIGLGWRRMRGGIRIQWRVKS